VSEPSLKEKLFFVGKTRGYLSLKSYLKNPNVSVVLIRQQISQTVKAVLVEDLSLHTLPLKISGFFRTFGDKDQ